MNILDFATQEEIDQAPDDPALAFIHLVRIAQKRLAERLMSLDSNDRDNEEPIERAKFGFVMAILGAAKAYEIAPFTAWSVPRFDDFSNNTYRQFQSEIDLYMAEIVIANSRRVRRDGFLLPSASKERIRTYLHHLKDEIDKADISDDKRAKLLKKLAEFELALEKDRLDIKAVGIFVMTVLGMTASGAAIADSPTIQRLLTNVVRVASEAYDAEEERRQIPPIEPAPVALIGEDYSRRKESFSADLDEEIPF